MEIEKEKLFRWIRGSTKGLNCVVYGCKEPPEVMCTCGYYYCFKHGVGNIPKEIDPHTIDFAKKWNWEDFRKFMYEGYRK